MFLPEGRGLCKPGYRAENLRANKFKLSLELVRQSPPCMNAIVPIVKNNEKHLVIIVCMHGGLCLTSPRDVESSGAWWFMPSDGMRTMHDKTSSCFFFEMSGKYQILAEHSIYLQYHSLQNSSNVIPPGRCA